MHSKTRARGHHGIRPATSRGGLATQHRTAPSTAAWGVTCLQDDEGGRAARHAAGCRVEPTQSPVLAPSALAGTQQLHGSKPSPTTLCAPARPITALCSPAALPSRCRPRSCRRVAVRHHCLGSQRPPAASQAVPEAITGASRDSLLVYVFIFCSHALPCAASLSVHAVKSRCGTHPRARPLQRVLPAPARLRACGSSVAASAGRRRWQVWSPSLHLPQRRLCPCRSAACITPPSTPRTQPRHASTRSVKHEPARPCLWH